MLLPHGTVIAVIDARNFNLFRNTGDEAHPELTEIAAPKLDAHNHSAGSHHGSTATMTEDAHAIAVVEWLNDEVAGHRVEHVVVAAPPRTMGELRKHYSKSFEKALLGEISKDLHGRKGPELLEQLRGK